MNTVYRKIQIGQTELDTSGTIALKIIDEIKHRLSFFICRAEHNSITQKVHINARDIFRTIGILELTSSITNNKIKPIAEVSILLNIKCNLAFF